MKLCICGHERRAHRNMVDLEGNRHTNCLEWDGQRGCRCDRFYEAAE